MEIRRRLHKRGLRYRVDRTVLPGSRRRVDIVFPRERVAVLVHGCFWHSCPLHATLPKANGEWWAEKLRVNRERDQDTERTLVAAGWEAVLVWEHEDPAEAAARIEATVMRRRSEVR
jgi:DNA mismatch endonuclease (patch repair protein)